MKPVKKIGLLIALCLSQLFIQCSTDDNKVIEEKIAAEQYTDEVILLRDFLSKSLPMDIKKIIYDSDLSAFIIDGDVLMPLEQARGHYSHSNLGITSKTKQRGSEYKMTLAIAASIKVYISPEVSSEWRIAIDQAINHWNTINSSIAITVVNTSTSSNIKINAWDGGLTKAIAYGSLPYFNGEPGDSILINTFYNNLSMTKKVHAMVHEFGHTFGLNHTNQSQGPLLPCTPISDDASVMFSIVREWTGFTPFDNIAISTLYPVAVGTKKLYRYRKDQYYFYTTDACEIIPGKNGYVFDGYAGYLYTKQITGTVPLYRSLNPGTTIKDHRLHRVQTSLDNVVVGYLYPTRQPGTTQLYGTYSSYEYFPVNYAHYLYTTKFDKDAVIMFNLGYIVTK